MIDTKTDELACPACKTREDLVVTGLDVAAILGRYQSDNDATWCVTCFGCRGQFRINDAARDELFGTGWRASKEDASDE